MPAGTPIALATIRVKRGEPRPSEAAFREAIERDRVTLGLAPMNGLLDITFAGPYTILVDGEEIDEWVVWER